MWGAVASTEMALADEAENLLENEEALAAYCLEVTAMTPPEPPSASESADVSEETVSSLVAASEKIEAACNLLALARRLDGGQAERRRLWPSGTLCWEAITCLAACQSHSTCMNNDGWHPVLACC